MAFKAPEIDTETRCFTLQLDFKHQAGKPSSAQLNIRVHRKDAKTTERAAEPMPKRVPMDLA